jgi:hypothetical protein
VDGALRTTGAPKSVTLGAEDARGAARTRAASPPVSATHIDLPSAIPVFLDACGRLASDAAARGDLATARDLADKAARVAAMARVEQSTP